MAGCLDYSMLKDLMGFLYIKAQMLIVVLDVL